MCDKVILEKCGMLMVVPDGYKNQEVSNKAADNYSHALKLPPIAIRPKKCIIKLLILLLRQYNLFLNDAILKKCVISCRYLSFCV